MFCLRLTDAEFHLAADRRGEVQERALGVALEMASQMLDRCVTLISAQVSSPRLFVPPDVQVMLPALKVSFCFYQQLFCTVSTFWIFMISSYNTCARFKRILSSKILSCEMCSRSIAHYSVFIKLIEWNLIKAFRCFRHVLISFLFM